MIWPVVAFSRILETMVLAIYMVSFYGAPIVVRGIPALWFRSILGSMGLLSTFYSLPAHAAHRCHHVVDGIEILGVCVIVAAITMSDLAN